MVLIQNINLEDFLLFPRMSMIAPRALLQIKLTEEILICMRCFSQDDFGQRIDGVAVLDGDQAGRFINDEELSDPPAVDVGKLVRVTVKNPAPRVAGAASLNPGDICLGYGTTYASMALSRKISPERVTGYLALQGVNVGQIFAATPNMYIGRASVELISNN